MPYEFGGIVLVPFPFPFTNQAASKKRPAVIVSNLGRLNEAERGQLRRVIAATLG